MRKKLIALLLSTATSPLVAQIPNFAGTCGDGKINGYTSVKFHPGINMQQTYTSFFYGIGEHFSTGTDLYTEKDGGDYFGFAARYGNKLSKWFNFGIHITPSFDLNDNFHFSYLTNSLYLVGAITSDEKLFWCTNTYYTINDGSDNSVTNLEYLAYNIEFDDRHSLTPMVGAGHSWRFDEDVDLIGGAYYSVDKWSFYLWGGGFLKEHPRVVVGAEFVY